MELRRYTAQPSHSPKDICSCAIFSLLLTTKSSSPLCWALLLLHFSSASCRLFPTSSGSSTCQTCSIRRMAMHGYFCRVRCFRIQSTISRQQQRRVARGMRRCQISRQAFAYIAPTIPASWSGELEPTRIPPPVRRSAMPSVYQPATYVRSPHFPRCYYPVFSCSGLGASRSLKIARDAPELLKPAHGSNSCCTLPGRAAQSRGTLHAA